MARAAERIETEQFVKEVVAEVRRKPAPHESTDVSRAVEKIVPEDVRPERSTKIYELALNDLFVDTCSGVASKAEPQLSLLPSTKRFETVAKMSTTGRPMLVGTTHPVRREVIDKRSQQLPVADR